MNSRSIQNYNNLLSEMSPFVIYAVFEYNAPWESDWEYTWSLDIMNLGFPFLY